MGDIFLTGSQGQATSSVAAVAAPTLISIPDYDGTQQGLINVVQALVNNVRQLGGQQPDPQNSSSTSSNPSKKKGQGRFQEINRKTEKVTITDPDSGASLTYNQITLLTLQDTVTKEQWTWQL